MKAVQIDRHGGLEALKIVDLPIPEPGSGQIQVKLQAAALNHLDIWVRRGFPGVPLPIIPGSDGAGVVTATGTGVTKFQAGNLVLIQPLVYCGNCRFCQSGRENYCDKFGIFGETEDGTNCEYIVVDEKYLRLKPASITLEEAAAFPLVSMTAYTMLISRAELSKEDTVLVWGAGSGVGHMAVQIAKWKGCFVIATAGTQEKMDQAARLGADLVLNHHSDNIVETVRQTRGKAGVDVIFEHVGKSTWDTSTRLLAKGGRLVTCGATTGSRVEIDLRHIFYKQQSIIGSTMGDVNGFSAVIDLVERELIKPVIAKTFPLDDIREAHRFLEQGGQFGKVVLTF